MTSEDTQITDFFSYRPRTIDENFVARITIAVEADRQLAANRAAAWRRFAKEVLVSSVIMLVFVFLGRLDPLAGEQVVDQIGTLGPAMAAVSILALWFMLELRPSRRLLA